MSTEFFNDQWRIPSNENQNKVSNYSMDFDGSSTLIDLGSTLGDIGTSTTTFSFWLNITTSTSHQTVLSNRGSGGGWAIDMFDVSGQYILSFFNASSSTAIRCILNDFNTWVHIVIVRDGISNNKIYINGVSQTLTTNNENLTNIISTKTLTIGAQDPLGTGYYRFLNGKIDQVTVFDYALSASQVSTLYGGGTAVTNPMTLSPKPISYYQLGDQSVSTGPTSSYLVPNNSLSDYVFNIDSSNVNYIDLGTNPFSFTQNLTVSFWMKSTQTASNTFIGKDINVSGGRNWMVMLYQTRVYFWTSSTGSISNLKAVQSNVAGGVSDGKWHHIVCVNNQTNATKQIYIDGVLDVTNNNGGLISTSSSPVQIGKRLGGFPYDGEMSNVALWNTVLTGPQVATIYNNGAPNDISSLSPTAWYKLNAADTFNSSTSTWTINDYGSGGNDGTSSGMDSSNLVVSDLQKTNGFSPYALSLDGINDYLDTPQIDLGSTNTISFWINTTTTTQGAIFGDPNGYADYALFSQPTLNRTAFRLGNNDSGYYQIEVSSGLLNDGNWHHHCLTRDGVTINYYIDGILQTNVINNTLNASAGTNTTIENIFAMPNGTYEYGGKLSNVALWNIELTSTEVTEIFNEGRPSDLNNFSGTAPVSWWQIGSNSSYNSGAWTCLDETGTNNAVSVNMANNDIVDGPGYSASGVGTSSIDIKGNAPYSSANGLSNSMDVLDRTTDVPS